MVKRALEDQVPQELERCWKQLVLQDIESNPLLAREVAHVEADQGLRARKQVEENPILAYGATLLIVVVHPQYLACIQLGDGDIVSVDDDGVAVRPVEEDGRLLANETTSLACEQAWRDFRVTFQSLCGRPPALLLASTDGYSNSFRSAEDFLKVGPDLLELIADEGIEAVQQKLPDWLADASRNGSGDDVSLGIILRRDVIHSLQEDVERLLDSPKPDRRGDESPSSIPSNTPSS